MTNILILNQHTGNFGDDAAGYAAVQTILRYFKDANICISYNKFDDNKEILPYDHPNITHHHSHFDHHSARAFLPYWIGKHFGFNLCATEQITSLEKEIKAADIIFISPCGSNIGIYRNWKFLFRVMLAVLHKKKVYFYSNTIADSGHILFNALAKHTLKRCHVIVRELKSYAHMRSIGMQATHGVDTAFSLKPQSGQEEGTDGLPFQVIEPKNRKQEIAFIPTQLNNWHPSFKGFDEPAFQEELTKELADFANKHNLKVRIIPHLHSSIDEEGLLSNYTNKINQHAGSDIAFVDHDIKTFWDYSDALAHAEMSVSMRYHGAVFSIKRATSCVLLAYENKMREVASYGALDDQFHEILNWSHVQFSALLENSWKQRESVTERLKKRCKLLQKLAELPAQTAWLQETLRHPGQDLAE